MAQIPLRIDETEEAELVQIIKLLDASTRNGGIKRMIMLFRSLHTSNIEKDAEILRLNKELKTFKDLIANQERLEVEEAKLIADSETRIQAAAKAKKEAIQALRKFTKK